MAEVHNTEQLTDYYSQRQRFVELLIERLKRSGEPLTIKSYNEVDMINWTQGEGVNWFMKKYSPGKSIVDVGAGYGGITRMLKD